MEIGQLSERELTRYRSDKIGFVFQQFHLVPYLTALENVMLAQYFHSITDERRPAKPCAAWAWATGWSIFPRSFPAASSNAWPSRAR